MYHDLFIDTFFLSTFADETLDGLLYVMVQRTWNQSRYAFGRLEKLYLTPEMA